MEIPIQRDTSVLLGGTWRLVVVRQVATLVSLCQLATVRLFSQNFEHYCTRLPQLATCWLASHRFFCVFRPKPSAPHHTNPRSKFVAVESRPALLEQGDS